MASLTGRVALVTGASSGIGEDIARKLVTMGMKVVGCGRNVKNIEELAVSLAGSSGSLTPIRCDVSKEADILDMFQKIESLHGRLDVLINNAGLSNDAPILTGATEQWREMLNVNVLAVTICTREAYKLMKNEDNKCHIICISSILGHKQATNSKLHFYSATKFTVRAIAEAINNELREAKANIRVTSISPGLVETQWLYRGLPDDQEFVAATYNMFKSLEAKDVTEAVIYALSAPPHVQVRDIILTGTEQVI